MIKTPLLNKLLLFVLMIVINTTLLAAVNVTESPKGILTTAPAAYTGSAPSIHDGSTTSNWKGYPGKSINVFEFVFDPDLNGTASEASDQFTLDSISLFSPGDTLSVKEFLIQTQSNSEPWQRLYSTQAIANPYNFATSARGGKLTVAPNAYTGSASSIHDSTPASNWKGYPGRSINVFEFVFDPDLNGTASEISDRFTLDSISLFSPGDTLSVKEFLIQTQNNGGPWQRLYSTQAITDPYNFALTARGGKLVVSPAAYTGSASSIHDSSLTSNWKGYPGRSINVFEFVFDPDLNGTASEIADQFTLDSISLFSPGDSLSVKEFLIQTQNNGGLWQRLYSTQAIADPYNFALTARGGKLVVSPAAYTGSASSIHDSSLTSNWKGYPGRSINVFEFVFDPDLNGTASEIADQFTLDSISLFSPGDSLSVKDFQLEVETTSGWQPAIALQALQISTEQPFNIGPFNDVVRVRLTTLNNYGHSQQKINEFKIHGTWNGDNPIFKAEQLSSEQIFDLTSARNNDGRKDNITKLRFQTVNNYGHSQQKIQEFKIHGTWNGDNPIFKAEQLSSEQIFDLTSARNNDGRKDNITKLRFQTVNNYGHSQQKIQEFKIHGTWNGDNPIFKAEQLSSEQIFDLTSARNNDGRKDNITKLRFQTVNNYGHSQQKINEFQAFGIINEDLIGAFNAFDTVTTATAIIGSLQTRVANNASISFDVIALNTDKSAVDASFTKDVKIELLANMASVALDANSCPVTSTVIATLAVAAISNGRSTVTMPVTNNVWKEVYVRMSYQPPVGPLIIACAIDKFAIRPAAFTLVAQHNNWETAGSSQTINDSAPTENTTHKAGRPFSLQLKAIDSAGTIMTNYDDIPILIDSYPALVSPAGGILGMLNLGTLTNSNGVISSDTAHYSEVGAISLKMNDEDFAGVDAADGTSITNRTISSPEITIGRFIPDHFKATTVNNGSFDDACTNFTYSGQPFTYQTAPELKITAYNSASAITQNYSGSFAKLTPSDFSVTTPTSDAVKLQVNNIDLISLNWNPAASSLNDNADGSLNFTFGTDSYNHLHDANSLVAPYTNTVNLSFTAITDSDGVTTQALPHILQATGGSVRFGRIAINNAHGSELTPLSVAIKMEYFNGIDWTTNTADQCTTLILASQLQLSNPETGGGGWLAGNTTITIASGATASTLTNNNPLANGSALLSLSAPGEDNQGYVNIRSQISGSYNWLLGDYNGNGIYDNEASARASFGLFKGSDTIIFRREIY